MQKVPKELSSRIQSEDPSTKVELNILLQRDLARPAVMNLLDRLKDISADQDSVKFSPFSGMAEISATLGAIKQIANHPSVIHIAENGKEKIENLID